MTKELTVQQSRALDLRSYLQSDNVKSTLMQALPKWLSADRLLRIVFSSAMRNPKLLECSQESILQSVMMCAQLGLEPILGRAYLIPYNSRKNINGKWTSISECQMQVGYQGLIDLARRSGNIADVWGAVVYENDDFRLDYGMDRGLTHTPWFMDPEKRKANAPGDALGAYVVWQLKDGTKHPDFMPIHEIYKRRAKSQSYMWAETGDPQKGGGKRDSVWHEWHDDMAIKTVLKHSAKMVPSSIEFMQAIEMDNDAEIGHPVRNPFSYDVGPLQIESGTDFELAAQFDEALTEIPDGPQILQWFTKIADASNMTLEAAKAEVIRTNDLDNCIANYRAQLPKTKAKEVNNVQSPDTGSNGPGGTGNEPWNPETSELQQRYPADKAQAVKECAERLGIDPRGKVARVVHAEILEAAKAKPVDQKQLMLMEKFNELWVSASKMAKNWAQITMEPNLKDGERPPEDRIGEWVQLVEEYAANEERM